MNSHHGAKRHQINVGIVTTGVLTVTMMLTGAVMTSIKTHADDDSATDEVQISVPTACTMTGTGQASHTASLDPGTYSAASGSDYVNGIGKTTITTFCNDYEGFSIYAIGFSGNTEGDNTLKGTSASGNATIATKAYEQGDTQSNWSMKLTKVTDTTTSFNPSNMTITQGYDNTYHAVPDDYTKVVEYKASTGSSSTDQTLGAKLETTYAVYISTTQPADTYTGQVKYVMVHPYNATAPQKPVPLPTPPESCNTPVTGITYMQEINSTNKTNILSSLTEDAPYYLYDNRDNEPYCVAKLKDGNLWMLDNLRLDIADPTVVNNTTATNTNASALSLGYLKNGGGTESDQYAITGIKEWTESPTYSSSSSYTDPLIATSGICDNTTNCANTPESGRWTKDSIPKNNDVETKYGAGSGKIGIYYNYCAASAGSYCYTFETGPYIPDTLIDVTEDICPSNWRMPTGGQSSNSEYYILRNNFYTGATASQSDSVQAKLSTPLAGTFFAGKASNQGDHGYLWSVTNRREHAMHVLGVYSADTYPGDWLSRNNGFSVRCILKP